MRAVNSGTRIARTPWRLHWRSQYETATISAAVRPPHCLSQPSSSANIVSAIKKTAGTANSPTRAEATWMAKGFAPSSAVNRATM